MTRDKCLTILRQIYHSRGGQKRLAAALGMPDFRGSSAEYSKQEVAWAIHEIAMGPDTVEGPRLCRNAMRLKTLAVALELQQSKKA